jgi:hypothetical protein
LKASPLFSSDCSYLEPVRDLQKTLSEGSMTNARDFDGGDAAVSGKVLCLVVVQVLCLVVVLTAPDSATLIKG